jgi:gluconolactonase
MAQSSPAQEIQRLDPSASAIVPDKAHVERVVTGFNKWTEGPVWTRDGSLLFAEIPANNIVRWLDAQGRLTVAGHARHNVWRLESMNPSAQITVLADSYEGKPLNSPNDVVYKSDGSLYFTDPPYGLRTQSDDDPEKKLSFNGVYRIPNALQQKPASEPDRGKLQLIIRDLPRPNGIAFSPDEKYLYVSDSGKLVWMRYDVAPDGSVSNGIVFMDSKGGKGLGGPDGIKVDTKGNLYGSGPGGVWIISPSGKHIATIGVPERVGNLAWGDKDAKTLYITASTSIYRIKLNIAGVMAGKK